MKLTSAQKNEQKRVGFAESELNDDAFKRIQDDVKERMKK